MKAEVSTGSGNAVRCPEHTGETTGHGGSDPVLSVSGLTFAYPDSPLLFSDLNLEIGEGERVGLIGPNGAGKSTLFLLLCGVLKAGGGDVRCAGVPLSRDRFRPALGMVFQNTNDQLFCPTVREDVAFGPANLGLAPREVSRRVEEALGKLGVAELADRPVDHLSEGERRLVAIAGVLAMSPSLILYDEPSANLDIRFRRRLISFLQHTAKTIVIASHDLELVLETCHRVILMDRGRVIADGVPEIIMSDQELMEAHGQEKPHSLVPHAVFHRHGAGPGG